jgi:hypothetical protein
MQEVPFTYIREDLPKIKGLAELKGESYCNHFDKADISPTWRQRLMKFFFPESFTEALSLHRKNNRLRVQLLNALVACEDAGRNGLKLYYENEALREQVETGSEERLVRLHDLDKLANENRELKDKLQRAYKDYERLRAEVDDWVQKFGEQGK